jgi:hypothetical protein
MIMGYKLERINHTKNISIISDTITLESDVDYIYALINHLSYQLSKPRAEILMQLKKMEE